MWSFAENIGEKESVNPQGIVTVPFLIAGHNNLTTIYTSKKKKKEEEKVFFLSYALC